MFFFFFSLLCNNFLFALLRMRLCDFLVKMGKVVEEHYSVFFWERVIATEQGHSWSIIWWISLESCFLCHLLDTRPWVNLLHFLGLRCLLQKFSYTKGENNGKEHILLKKTLNIIKQFFHSENPTCGNPNP